MLGVGVLHVGLFDCGLLGCVFGMYVAMCVALLVCVCVCPVCCYVLVCFVFGDCLFASWLYMLCVWLWFVHVVDAWLMLGVFVWVWVVWWVMLAA